MRTFHHRQPLTRIAITLVVFLSSVASAQSDDGAASRFAAIWAADAIAADDVAWLADPDARADRLTALRQSIADGSLWRSIDAGAHRMQLQSHAGGPTIDVALALPDDYSPDRDWPVLITMHGTGGNGVGQLRSEQRRLGNALQGLIVASPTSPVGGAYQNDPREPAHPVQVLAALSQKLRLDRDRVYLSGYSKGGHAAFITAAVHPSDFAGVMPMAGTFLARPWFEHQVRLLTPNLAGLPVWVVYGQNDTGAEQGQPPADANTITGIAATNQLVAEKIKQRQRIHPGLQSVRFVELPGIGHRNTVPPDQHIKAMFEQTRPAIETDGRAYALAFRRESESFNRCLRVLDAAPPLLSPTERPKLRIRPGQSVNAALEQWVDDRFGRTELQIHRADGQRQRFNRVIIKADKARALELWLNEDLIDFTRRTIVTVNGRSVFSGQLQPDALQAMHWLRLTGDTSRLMTARLQIPRPGKARPNPTQPPPPRW